MSESRALLEIEGAGKLREWSNGPGDIYASHSHSFRKVLYCVEGGIVFHLGSRDLSLSPGDRLVIEPGEVHSATVGADGVTCVEGELGI